MALWLGGDSNRKPRRKLCMHMSAATVSAPSKSREVHPGRQARSGRVLLRSAIVRSTFVEGGVVQEGCPGTVAVRSEIADSITVQACGGARAEGAAVILCFRDCPLCRRLFYLLTVYSFSTVTPPRLFEPTKKRSAFDAERLVVLFLIACLIVACDEYCNQRGAVRSALR